MKAWVSLGKPPMIAAMESRQRVNIEGLKMIDADSIWHYSVEWPVRSREVTDGIHGFTTGK